VEDRRTLERGEELVRQPALADPGLAVDRDEVSAAVAGGARECVLEQLELVVTADERRDRDAGGRAAVGARRGPSPDRLVAAAHLNRADVVDLDPAHREPVRGGTEQDLARLRELLQSGGDVDRFAGGERGVAGAGDDLSRLDADAGLQLEVVDRVENLERRANRALRVVLVRLGNPESGHDGVPGELLDGPAVGLDAARDLVEEPGHAPAHDLRIAR
jgi:hypothetical protein